MMQYFYVTRVLDDVVAGPHYCCHICCEVLGIEVLQVGYRNSVSALGPGKYRWKMHIQEDCP